MDTQGISQEGFQTAEEYNSKPENQQMTLFSLQELAVSNTNSIEEIQKQLKTATEMYNDSFANDAKFKEEQEKVKDQQKSLKVVKANIERQPSVIAMANKVKELKNELKEKKASVSDYAMEVFRMSGNTEFEKDGKTYDIKTVAKLVERKQ